jgi:hypothetical protein
LIITTSNFFLINAYPQSFNIHGSVNYFVMIFFVEYRPGKLNAAVDALSRREEDASALNSISAPQFQLFDTLIVKADSDPQVIDVRTKLAAETTKQGWTLVYGLLLFKGKVFVSEASFVWALTLADAHECGHEGIEKTLHWWRASFYGPARCTRFGSWCRTVLLASGTRWSTYILLIYYNPYQYLHRFGVTLQWILWRGSRRWAANQWR